MEEFSLFAISALSMHAMAMCRNLLSSFRSTSAFHIEFNGKESWSIFVWRSSELVKFDPMIKCKKLAGADVSQDPRNPPVSVRCPSLSAKKLCSDTCSWMTRLQRPCGWQEVRRWELPATSEWILITKSVKTLDIAGWKQRNVSHVGNV